MDTKKIFLKIIFFLEIILSTRTLLFTIPVFITQATSEQTNSSPIDSRIIIILTGMAVCYLVTGLLSLLKPVLTRILHLSSFVVVLVLSLIFLKQGNGQDYYLLLGAVIFATALILSMVTFIKPEKI